MFLFAKILFWTSVWDEFVFKYLRFDLGMPRGCFFLSEKIKKVLDWIFIKGRIFIIADTTTSLRKEHINMQNLTKKG